MEKEKADCLIEEPEKEQENTGEAKDNASDGCAEAETWRDKMLSKFIGRRHGNIV